MLVKLIAPRKSHNLQIDLGFECMRAGGGKDECKSGGFLHTNGVSGVASVSEKLGQHQVELQLA